MRLKWLFLFGILLTMAVPALAQDANRHVVRQQRDTLALLAREYNVCLDSLRAANPVLSNTGEYDYLAIAEVVIPDEAPCYEIVLLTSNNPGASLPELSKEHNVCLEELFNSLEYVPENQFKVYIPVNAPACFNEQGQRLSYFDDRQLRRDEPVYVDTNVIAAPVDLQQSAYCAGDVLRANPQLTYMGYFEGSDMFLPDTVRHCTTEKADRSTLYGFSRRYNVCMEAIQSANFYFNPWDVYQADWIQIPVDTPACYDDAGNRLNHDDKAVHRSQSREALFDVALKYDVCLQDLRAANPAHYRGEVRLPEVLFIPDTPPCDNSSPVEHPIEKGDTLQALSMEYNVCYNRIIEANAGDGVPFEEVHRTGMVDQLKIGATLKIPVHRPDCYTLAWENPLEMVNHVCYAEAVDLDRDYSGHEPPISPIVGTESGFCHERSSNTPVIYQNEKLTVYKLRPLDTFITVGQCFGVETSALVEANAQNYPWEVRPEGYWIIPEPYNHDCYLLTADTQTYYARETQLGYHAGYIDENGVYTVNYQDTLSAIGREYGYLPSWIAAVNNLPNANMIYYRQELKMPPYPSLHIIGKVAAVGGVPVLLAIAGYGLVRWRRSSKRKRKNDTA